LSHNLVPIRSAQERDILASVCAIDSRRFITGGMDRRVLLWNLDTSTSHLRINIKTLSVRHAASVKALAYASSRQWLVSAAGSKLAITDMAADIEFMIAGRQKWASNGIYNLHVHEQDDNLLLLEVCIQIFRNGTLS
jgi:WD40 repeat protein